MAKDPAISLLAIDDDPTCLSLIEGAMAGEGLQVFTTTKPQEGLEMVYRYPPQIVLLDLRMPEMDGIEVLERIVEADPATEVVLMTAHQSIETAVEAIRKGASDYLTKPLALDRLRGVVGKLAAEASERQKTTELDRQM